MEVELTAERQAFVREAIQAGRIQCEEDAVQQALSLWEEQERRPSSGPKRRLRSLLMT